MANLLRTGIGRISRTARGFASELRAAWRVSDDLGSFGRIASDFVLFRVIGFVQLPSVNQERTVHLRGSVALTYRLNRGDIQSFREVWLEDSYLLPFPLEPDTVVDLGANIGLTSLWLATRYHIKRVIAVEASPENARLARRNLEQNGIAADVIAAAVGPHDGTVRFNLHKDSNLGTIDPEGTELPMISMAKVLERLPEGAVDLLKMDIEGGEQALLDGELGWLHNIRAIIAEFHPLAVDYPGLTARLERQGFRYFPANSVHHNSMDAFLRPPSRQGDAPGARA
jgi:FkbM family methyltransferase